MSIFKIYHNPRCRKSREAYQILQEKGIEPEVVLYLEEVPTVKELKHLGQLMGKGPMEFIRKNEDAFKDHIKGKDLNDEKIFELMHQYPILIERPIVVKDDREAVLGRPPADVLQLI